LNSAKIQGQLKRLILLGTPKTGKKPHRTKLRNLAITAQPKAHGHPPRSPR
jgi:hypothetical protein